MFVFAGVTIDAHMCFDSQFPLSRPEEEHWVRVPPALEVFLPKNSKDTPCHGVIENEF